MLPYQKFATGLKKQTPKGQTCIASPKGKVLTEPVEDKEELFVVDLDFDHIADAKLLVDSVGHYARPDVLRLTIDRRAQVSVIENRDNVE